MNHWSFIIAAYVLTGLGTFGMLAWSFAAMRRAEGRVDALRQEK
ncbi:MAG: hypothetical protein ABL918_09925 [Chakrabartia sp.]